MQHELLTASHSIDFAQSSSHRPSAWAEELPSISRLGKGEHRRHIHIHIFTTPAVRVQHDVTVHVIVTGRRSHRMQR